MQRIESSITAEAKVLADIQAVLSTIKRLSGQQVDNIQLGVAQLRVIRSSVYEDINQIQHEYLILRALRWLLEKGFASEITWEWNPRQTGTANEPDLIGSSNCTVLISAEASASEKPVRVIDSRMKGTLHKLSKMAGQKYYFVCSEEMACRYPYIFAEFEKIIQRHVNEIQAVAKLGVFGSDHRVCLNWFFLKP